MCLGAAGDNAVPPRGLLKPSRETSTHLTEDPAKARRDREGLACVKPVTLTPATVFLQLPGTGGPHRSRAGVALPKTWSLELKGLSPWLEDCLL